MFPFYYKNILKIDADNFSLKIKKSIFLTLALWEKIKLKNHFNPAPHANLNESTRVDLIIYEGVFKKLGVINT